MKPTLKPLLLVLAITLAALYFSYCFRNTTAGEKASARKSPQSSQSHVGKNPSNNFSQNVQKIGGLEQPNQTPDRKAFRLAQLGRIDPLDNRLADQLDDLKSRAKTGDASAALHLWKALQRCSQLLAAAETVDPNPAVESNAAERSNCDGITAADLRERTRWLRMAAERGDFAAQYLYAQNVFDMAADGRSGDEKNFYFLNNPGALQESADTARRYLENLDHLCNQQALYATYVSYSTGFLHEKNPTNEYLYLRILKKSFDDQTVEESEDAVRAKLTVNQLEAIDQSADKYVANYCN